ncbi:MAG TPA: discoidin domain-containing protein [Anaerolineales bacterium]|nr:discoidin domain-containing protein [Anaerolineales bacterium]
MKRTSSSKNGKIIDILKDMDSPETEYPAELLSARRAAFIDQIAKHDQLVIEEELTPGDLEIIDLLKQMKKAEEKYPSTLMAARRSAFMRQITWMHLTSLWYSFSSAIEYLLTSVVRATQPSSMKGMHTSLVIASLIIAAFVGFLSYENRDRSPRLAATENEVSQPVAVLAATSTPVIEKIICKPGYEPPLCLAGALRKNYAMTYQGNGSARPAVAKDTIPGFGEVHQASNLNDGLYGPGTSWVSNSRNSWIKIDLGKAAYINTVTFGRDRLGKLNDGDPGQFVIAVALSDDAYVNGNNSNDGLEYTAVYNSKQEGFAGNISGAETVVAQFDEQVARYIKITFENQGTAIDEVEVYMVKPPLVSGDSGRTPKDREEDSSPTPLPTNTQLPTDTPTTVPTNTPPPTDTAVPPPSETPIPTSTATPLPTNTPRPTRTPVPSPTDTPSPTRTPIPSPTDTPPPTRTPIPSPTDTPPPTDTAIPNSTDMPIPSGYILQQTMTPSAP